jgi:hypothetical protein
MEANIRTSSRHALEERRLARQLAQPVAFKPFHVRALWGFEARMPEELGFRQGDIITVAEPIEGDWWKRPASRSGWVFLFELRRGDANSVAPELLATPITYISEMLTPDDSLLLRLSCRDKVKRKGWHICGCQHFSCVAHFCVSILCELFWCLWCQGCSGISVALVSALLWCQQFSGISISPELA